MLCPSATGRNAGSGRHEAYDAMCVVAVVEENVDSQKLRVCGACVLVKSFARLASQS